MGVNKKTDGRYIVGMGAPNENEYKGSMGWRDIFIQLTENGATPDSEEKLAFLRDYAIYHNGEGNAIMPPSVSVWVSNNGVTSAVNADDITLEDGTYTICGIKWDGSSWDYTNAGQSSGGGGSSLPSVTDADNGDVLTVVDGAWDKAAPSGGMTLIDLNNLPVEERTVVDVTPNSSGTVAYNSSTDNLWMTIGGTTNELLAGSYYIGSVSLPCAFRNAPTPGVTHDTMVGSITHVTSSPIANYVNAFYVTNAVSVYQVSDGDSNIIVIDPTATIQYGNPRIK